MVFITKHRWLKHSVKCVIWHFLINQKKKKKEKFAIKLFLVEQERLSHSGDMESKTLKILRRLHWTAKAWAPLWFWAPCGYLQNSAVECTILVSSSHFAGVLNQSEQRCVTWDGFINSSLFLGLSLLLFGEVNIWLLLKHRLQHFFLAEHGWSSV